MASRVSDKTLDDYIEGRFALVRRYAIALDLRDLRKLAREYFAAKVKSWECDDPDECLRLDRIVKNKEDALRDAVREGKEGK